MDTPFRRAAPVASWYIGYRQYSTNLLIEAFSDMFSPATTRYTRPAIRAPGTIGHNCLRGGVRTWLQRTSCVMSSSSPRMWRPLVKCSVEEGDCRNSQMLRRLSQSCPCQGDHIQKWKISLLMLVVFAFGGSVVACRSRSLLKGTFVFSALRPAAFVCFPWAQVFA